MKFQQDLSNDAFDDGGIPSGPVFDNGGIPSRPGWFEGREKKLRRYNDIDYRLIMILCCFLSFSFMIRLY